MDNKNVQSAIAEVCGALSKIGIAKGRTGPNGAFRGIDDIYNAVGPELASAGLVIIPHVLSREVTERLSSNNKPMFFVTVMVQYEIIGPDGSKAIACMYGEAMDMSDKATNKAMSAAYKYLCMQLFCIPIEGTPDADSDDISTASNEKIIPAQIEQIQSLLGQLNRDEKAYCKYLNVTDLASIPVSAFTQNLESLEAMLKKQGVKHDPV